MQKNSTVLVKNGVTNLLEKGSVVEAELTFDDLVRDLAPAFTRHIHEDSTLLDSLNRGIPGLAVNTQAVKLQHNLGLGGCFPLHFDTYVCWIPPCLFNCCCAYVYNRNHIVFLAAPTRHPCSNCSVLSQ